MKHLNLILGGLCLGLGFMFSSNDAKAENTHSNTNSSTRGDIVNEFQYELNDEGLTITAFPNQNEIFIPETAVFNGQVYPVTTIGDYASNSYVKILHVSSSINTINEFAFRESGTSENFYVNELHIESLYDWINIDFQYEFTSGVTFVAYTSYASPVNNYTKVYINNELLQTLVITDDFPELKPFVFSGFNLENIIFHETIKSIAPYSFYRCEVPELHIENIEKISFSAFSGSKINKIYTGPDLELIGSSAFSSMKGLTDFYFLSSPELGERVISSDYDKFTIHITEPLKFLYTAFYGSKIYCVDAPSLDVLLKGNFNSDQSPTHYISIDGVIQESISVPPIFQSNSPDFAEILVKEMFFEEGIEGIGLIMYMYDLEFLSFPSTLKSIKWIMGGYLGWPSDDYVVLHDIEIKAIVPPENEFDYYFLRDDIYFESCVLHVPAGCVEAYRNAPGWCNFVNITDEAYTSIDQINYGNRSEDNKIYDLNGRQVNPENLQKGIYIQNGKKILVKYQL